MTLHTSNRVTMRAPATSIYQLAADISQWPALLNHYRYVRVLEENGGSDGPRRRLVKMAASRSLLPGGGGIPVSWTSIQELEPDVRQIRYRHVRGVTKGMEVVWRIQPGSHGTHVSIDHDLESPYWWLRSPVARFIVGRIFISHIAGKTLHGIKLRAEAEMRGQPGP